MFLDLEGRVGKIGNKRKEWAGIEIGGEWTRIVIFRPWTVGYNKVFVKILTFERSFSKLSENHKIVDIASKMNKVIPS